MNLGAIGESLATEYLVGKQYEVIARNFRTRLGEIDIIVQNTKYLVFVEVKQRKNKRFGRACEAVTPQKQAKIIAAAEQWLLDHPTKLQPRFDVVEVYLPQDASITQEMIHIENAFAL